MNKRAKQVQLAVEDLDRVTAPTFDGRETLPALVHAVRRLMDARPGHPKAQSYDGPGGGFTPASKPPSGFGEADVARQQLALLDHSLNQLVLHARRVMDITATWAPHHASPKDRELSAANREPGCEWCASIPGPSGGSWWNEVHRQEHQLLDGTKAALCHACIRRYADTGGIKPSRDDLIHKRDHGKWPKTYEKTA